jgi:uncharacterized protein
VIDAGFTDLLSATNSLDLSLKLIGLGCGSFLAGCIDAIVGGGGLIQLPLLLLLFPQMPMATLFGTNKLASIAGTSIAIVQYRKRVELPDWVWSSAIVAGICSFIGAKSVALLNPTILKPLVLLLLIVVGLYSAAKPDLGQISRPRPARSAWIATAIAGILGLYDGFFGPGTGSFLILAMIGLLGLDFLTASAAAKVINGATNLTAIVAFASAGQVIYPLAIGMGLCNSLGAIVGTRLAVLKGNHWIRRLFLAVISLLISRLAWDLLR